MTRKRMSLRAIARMKRENRELRNEMQAVRKGYAMTRVSRLTLLPDNAAEIKTAHTLGYTTVIRNEYGGGVFGVYAIKLREEG